MEKEKSVFEDDQAGVFEADSKELENAPPADDQLDEVAVLARRQLDLKRQLDEAVKVTAVLADQLDEVSTNLLPDKMLELGLNAFELDTGEKISIEKGIAASITKKDQPAAFTWLREKGHGDIIKHELKANFGREQGDLADQALKLIDELGVTGKLNESVNHNTLKAFVREQLAYGTTFPESFTLFPWRKSVIKNL